MPTTDSTDHWADHWALRHHGDLEVGPGLLDFAVNVRLDKPPDWLRAALTSSMEDLARYPDDAAARHAVAQRHVRPPAEVLLTAGAAEAFVLLARALQPRHAVVVHPQFTEPEAALLAAGHPVDHVVLDARDGFILDAAQIPADADLVIIGNPTNPTSVLHPAAALQAIARPGRTLVVDEAFMDAVPGEAESLAGQSDVPGLIVTRSLTKTWALAGLRIGYALGDPAVLRRMRNAQPLWPVSTPALTAVVACSTPAAVQEAADAALVGEWHRNYLLTQLGCRPQIAVPTTSRAPFVLIHVRGADRVRLELRARGIAVRRGDTFPGLGPDWLRIAVREPQLTDQLISALSDVFADNPQLTEPPDARLKGARP